MGASSDEMEARYASPGSRREPPALCDESGEPKKLITAGGVAEEMNFVDKDGFDLSQCVAFESSISIVVGSSRKQ